MDTNQIPGTLPPAITIRRETAVARLADDLEDYGTTGPVALAWQWALTGNGPTPIALQVWTQEPTWPRHAARREQLAVRRRLAGAREMGRTPARPLPPLVAHRSRRRKPSRTTPRLRLGA